MGRTGKGMRAQLTSPCGPNTEAMEVTSVNGQLGLAVKGLTMTCHRIWAFVLCRIFVNGILFYHMMAVCRLGKKGDSTEKERVSLLYLQDIRGESADHSQEDKTIEK